MTQNLRSFFSVLLLLISFHFVANAQTATTGNATISSDFVITLNGEAPLAADYTFDISQLKFSSKEEAERFFSLCRDNLMNYTVNYDAKTATVHISLQYMEPRGWGISEYNEYFTKLAERYRNVYQAIHQ